MTEKKSAANFEVGEILNLKGMPFKIVLVDLFTGKICMKLATPEELREEAK